MVRHGVEQGAPLRRRTALPAIAVAILALVAGGSWGSGRSDAAASGITWSATGSPFRLTFRANGRELVRQAGAHAPGPGSRLGYRLSDNTTYALTALLGTKPIAGGTAYTVATTNPDKRAIVSVTRTARGARVELALSPPGGVSEIFEAFAAAPGEHFLGSGARGRYVDLRGQIAQIKVAYDCDSSVVTPFYLSSRGYGIAFDTTRTGQIQFAGSHTAPDCAAGNAGQVPVCSPGKGLDRVAACFRGDRLAYEVYAGSPDSIFRAHTALVGRPALPAPEQLALVKWRDEVTGAAELLDDARQLRSRGIPIGWVLLDNPWEQGGCHGPLVFDPVRFPRPAQAFAALRRLGLRTMLWISPYWTRSSACPNAGEPTGNLLQGNPDEWSIDFTDPVARKLFQERLRAVLELGVDGVKGDRADEVDLEDDRFAAGTGATFHNPYPALFAQAVTQVLRERKQPFAELFRGGYAGSQRAATGFWDGDREVSFAGLAEAVRKAQSASVSGFQSWGTDIGGYHRGFQKQSGPLAAPVFVRWAQFASFLPIFEVGGGDRNAKFWEFGATTTAQFRRAAILHYELFPTLYELLRQSSRSGVPLLRPLGLDRPGDAAAWRAELEFTLGKTLLVAPVAAAGAAHRVYVPGGSWVDVTSRRAVRGPVTFVRRTPLGETQAYLRAGAAIRFNGRTPDVWAKRWGVNDLDRPGREGWLYAPGPATARVGALTARTRGRTATISLRGARREAQLVVLAPKPPRAVSIGGKRIARATSLAALRRAASGWTYSDTAFGGVVVKLRGPSARVEVQLD